MTTQIQIVMAFGADQVNEDDLYRAEAAALASLVTSGFEPRVAYDAFVAAWEYLDSDEAYADGLAQTDTNIKSAAGRAWCDAVIAANVALTEGLANPYAAVCGISL